jgi:hypothetical protein
VPRKRIRRGHLEGADSLESIWGQYIVAPSCTETAYEPMIRIIQKLSST